MSDGMINPLPPAYIETQNAHNWLIDIFDSPGGLPCICGDQVDGRDIAVVRPYIVKICQRVDNPCKIDIDFHLGTANGLYYYQPNSSGFSINTTDGKNGDWYQLVPDINDPFHNPSTNNLSLAGSTTVDASWAYSTFDPRNPDHIMSGTNCNRANWANLGIPIHRFTFDMCEHLSTWLEEPKVSFRLSFDRRYQETIPQISCGVRIN
jgi:hypothetical protein